MPNSGEQPAAGADSVSTQSPVMISIPSSNPSPVGISPWSRHQRMLTALRSRLLAEWTEHRKEAAAPGHDNNDDFADRAREVTEHELAFAELAAEENQLVEVEAALVRLHNGSYGLCEETGLPIEPPRLRALPWTRFGHAAAERRERAKLL